MSDDYKYMFNYTSLEAVLIAYETHYKLKKILSRGENKIISIEGVVQGIIPKRVLLTDEDDRVNPNIIKMFDIILEKNMLTLINIKEIRTHVPEFKVGVNIIRHILSPSIQNKTDQETIIINITKIIDYLFRNLRKFLQNIADGIEKTPDVRLKSLVKYQFPSNIDLLFFFMIRIPEIHRGMLDDDIANEFVQILNLNNEVYTALKRRCNRGIIFIHNSVYYTCLYRTKMEGKSDREYISENSQDFMGKLRNMYLNAFELSSTYGLTILLGIISKLRPRLDSTLDERQVILNSSKTLLNL